MTPNKFLLIVLDFAEMVFKYVRLLVRHLARMHFKVKTVSFNDYEHSYK
jgi:hypothetical protein